MSTRTIKQKTCLRCGRTWWPRIPGRPTACPTCRSAYWDKERVYKQREMVTVTKELDGGVHV